MGDNLERLVLEILTRGTDRASMDLSKIGRSAGDSAGNVRQLRDQMDKVAGKIAQARVELKGNKEAEAALDRYVAKLTSVDGRLARSRVTVEGAARATVEIAAVDAELDKLGKKSETASTGLSALAGGGAGGGVGGMGALIGAGVALSPVIATLGVGLAGFGAAAYGAIAPIEKAAGKTGGLAANMAKLNPEQQALARSVLGLGKQYDQFQKALQPEVLAVFNSGIRIAGHLLHDVQPVAQATGKALNGFLGQVDKEFQSGTWQKFFGFMAREAAPDMQLLGQAFTAWLNALPPLIQDLQGVSSGLLIITKEAGSLTGTLATAAGKADQFGSSAQKAHGFWGKLGTDVVRILELRNLWDPAAKGADKAAAATGRVGAQAHTAAVQVQSLAQQVNGLTNAENKALSPLLAYTNALITQRNDADALNKALQTSHDKIGLATAAQRASFSAANTYIQDTLNAAAAAAKSHQNIDTVIASLRNELPRLQSARGGTREYWQEVSTLVGWLHRLQLIKEINEKVKVSGLGSWVPPVRLTPGQNAGNQPRGFAGGGYIGAGTTGTADDVLARVSRGELVVPARLVGAGMVDHLRGMIPGFASGGIIPSYSGRPGGLVPWGQHNFQATVAGITASIAGAMVQAIRAAAAAARSFGGGGGNPGPGGPGTLSATQIEGYWMRAGGPGGIIANIAQAITVPESGRRPSAVQQGQPYSTTGWGLWQITPGNSEPQAGINGALLNPMNNAIAAVAKYTQAGGSFRPWTTYMNGLYRPYLLDQGGWLMPGATLAVNNTGVPERVLPPGGGGNVNITVHVHAPVGSSPADIGRVIAEKLAAFKKSGGWIWKPGGF